MYKPSTIHFIHQVIIKIDQLISDQLDHILHHERFQKLESTYQGLKFLIHQSKTISHDKRVKIKILSISWHELSKDLHKALEFDQSQLFAKIYSDEFGHPGGEPFGLLIGDYYLTHQKNGSHNDIVTLDLVSKIAASAFSPFITSVSASFFGMDNFKSLDRPIDLQKIFQQPEYRQWRKLREQEDARFVGLVLPQVLIRKPYQDYRFPSTGFTYTENVSETINHYLWTNAVFCYASIITNAFSHSGWFTAIRGKAKHGSCARALATLIQQSFTHDQNLLKFQTNYAFTDNLEKHFSDHGLICLTVSQYTGLPIFYSASSIQKPKGYYADSAIINAKLSSMLHYMLCVSRFAHYLKMIARDKIGSFGKAETMQKFLQEWLYRYTALNDDLSEELKLQHPLREGKVQVFEPVGRTDKLLCTIHLCPHYQFDQLETYLHLRTELIRTL